MEAENVWRTIKTTWRESRLRVLATILLLLGFGSTVIAALSGSSEEPTPQPVSALLVGIGGLLQLGSAYLFSRSGKPDPTHAEASVRRIVNLASRCEDVSRVASAAQSLSAPEMRVALIDLSARLNYVAHDALASVEDWTSFNGDARRKVEALNDQAARAAIADARNERTEEEQ